MPETKVNELEIHVTQQDAYRFEVRFDKEAFPPLSLDEPPPLGKDTAPNASRILGAAIGNCLAASLVFCLGKHGAKVERGITSTVKVEIVRTETRRLRVGKVHVRLEVPESVPASALEECRALFEDFCTVTQSVRRGIEVEVELSR